MIDEEMISKLNRDKILQSALCEYRNYISNFTKKCRKINSNRAKLLVEKACRHFMRFIADIFTAQPEWLEEYSLALLDELYRLTGMMRMVNLSDTEIIRDINQCIEMFLRFTPLPESSNEVQSEDTTNSEEGSSNPLHKEKETDDNETTQESSINKWKIATAATLGIIGVGVGWYYFNNKKSTYWEPETVKYGASETAPIGVLMKTVIGTSFGLGSLGWLARKQDILKQEVTTVVSESDEKIIGRLKNTYQLDDKLNDALSSSELNDELTSEPNSSPFYNTDKETQTFIKHLKRSYSADTNLLLNDEDEKVEEKSKIFQP